MTAKPNRRLLPPEFQAAEYQRQDMIARPEPGTILPEMIVPAYWANVARSLKPLDRIEVRPQDGTWWAELLVRVVEPLAVGVHVLRSVDFAKAAEQQEAEAPDGYEFKHRGNRRWCVLRRSDNAVLREDEATRESAAAWLVGHLRKLAA